MHERDTDDPRSEHLLEHLLERANAAIRDYDLEAALGELERALAIDFEDDDVLAALKYVNFWRERERQIAGIGHEFERGQYLLDQWPIFESFVRRVGDACQPCLQSLRQFVFGSGLRAFNRLFSESESADAEVLLRIGRCHKGLGAYDEAARYLEAAAAENPSNAEVTAELADAYALVNEIAAAKAFFREAFFLDPQQVHLEVLESQMIRALVDKVAELGYEGEALREWLPVYGVLYGVFNVKRELRSIEYGKLKQSIYALERELREGRSGRELVEPRLINRYFWLIDHYVASGEDAAKTDEVLLKLRAVNDRIYRQYTN
ncbi:MAG: tetratricopeptide repeat protein [Spirochaetota bacterium]